MITLKLTPAQAAALLHTTDVNIAATRASYQTIARQIPASAWGQSSAALDQALDSLRELRDLIAAAITEGSLCPTCGARCISMGGDQ
jgi:hypothetical protein